MSQHLFNRKVEANLIYKLLVEPEEIGEVGDLSPSDFSVDDHRNLFAEIMLRKEKQEPIDVPLIESATGIEIDVLQMSAGATAKVKEYAHEIKELATRRRLIEVLENAKSKIISGEDAIDAATRAIEQLSRAGSAALATSTDATRAYRTDYTGRAAGQNGLPFGIQELDSILLPMRRGKLVIFAARPGIGKTAIAESIGDFAARTVPVLFVSLEMLATDLIDRGLARETGTPARDIIQGQVDIKVLDPHLVAREGLNITYLDKGGATVYDVQRAINEVKLRNGGEIGLVIVDYLQLLDGEPRNDEFQRVSNISHGLKRLAMANGVPVLALAQLNRQLEVDGGRSPRLADLAKSDSIGQDADAVVVIAGRVNDAAREFHVIKQRQGSTGRVDVMFDGSTQRWGKDADGVY